MFHLKRKSRIHTVKFSYHCGTTCESVLLVLVLPGPRHKWLDLFEKGFSLRLQAVKGFRAATVTEVSRPPTTPRGKCTAFRQPNCGNANGTPARV
eukprot:2189800-Rhodomonas_salina.1